MVLIRSYQFNSILFDFYCIQPQKGCCHLQRREIEMKKCQGQGSSFFLTNHSLMC